jgi:hypothetical protein
MYYLLTLQDNNHFLLLLNVIKIEDILSMPYSLLLSLATN